MQSSLQLPLGLRAPRAGGFQSYYAGETNRAVLSAVLAHANGEIGPFMFIHGAVGTGKTHLLSAACERVNGSAYLSMRELADQPVAVMEGVESLAYLCVDDLEVVSGDSDWERAVFNIYNAALASGARLLFAAQAPVAGLGLTLPDLESRLSSFTSFKLRALPDAERRQAFRQLLEQRGLSVTGQASRWIDYHLPRDIAPLASFVNHLDDEVWRSKRKITVEMLKSVANFTINSINY